MYVVRWNFKDGDTYIDTKEEIIKYADEVIEFLEEAVVFAKDMLADADTVSVELYECREIEIPS